MKGKCRVRNRATSEEARQGTAISGWPLRAVRIRLVAKGVLVIAVFKPAKKTSMIPPHSACTGRAYYIPKPMSASADCMHTVYIDAITES